MSITTCSGAISFSKELELQSAGFYEELAGRFAKDAELFLGFSKENRKFIVQVERAYYGVITDALEGCFAFDLDTGPFQLKTALPDAASYGDALSSAIEMEQKIIDYYKAAAEQSKHLMADVPRAFNLVVKKRSERIPKIKGLLGEPAQ